MRWGNDSLVEYQTDLVVVPRLCELCLKHTAVVWFFEIWPDCYLCRPCLDKRVAELAGPGWWRR